MSDVMIPTQGPTRGRTTHTHSVAEKLQHLTGNVLSWERGRLRQALPLVVSRCMAFSAMTRFDDDLIAAVREFYGLELDVATAEAEILEDEDERIRFFPWFLWDWRVDSGLPTVAERFLAEADHDRFEARLLEALTHSCVGFYEALEDAGPSGVRLRDMLSGEVFLVPDEGLEGDLFAHNVLQARLLKVPTDSDGHTVLVDAIYAVLPPEARPAVAVELSTIIGEEHKTAEADDVEDPGSASQTLSQIDKMKAFTPELLHFGDQLLENLARPPQAHNGEGDPLVLCTTTMPLSELGEDADVRALAKSDRLVRLHADKRQLYVFTDGDRAAGWVEVKGSSLVLGANSSARLDDLMDGLSDALGRTLPHRMRVLEDFHGAVQRWAEDGGGSRWLRADPDVRKATVTWLHAWARHWIDMPSAALGDKTPREAVRENGGRQRVEAMLERFESLTRGHLSTGLGDERPQLHTLRAQLGLPAAE